MSLSSSQLLLFVLCVCVCSMPWSQQLAVSLWAHSLLRLPPWGILAVVVPWAVANAVSKVAI
jgi:hypothetical protein